MAVTSSMLRDITMRIVNPDTTHEEFLEDSESSETSMTPDQLVERLNRMASALDASSNPSRELVLRDLNVVLASMEQQADTKGFMAGVLSALGLLGAIAVPASMISKAFNRMDLTHNMGALSKVNEAKADEMTSDIANELQLNDPETAKQKISDQYGGVGSKAFDAAFLTEEGVKLDKLGNGFNVTVGDQPAFYYDLGTMSKSEYKNLLGDE